MIALKNQEFSEDLSKYKILIDQDIKVYCDYLEHSTAEQYGPNGKEVVGVFTDLLKRGGKRVRGSLVMIGYELCGGKDQNMILQAARAIEMLQAYLLIIDDIQDNSVTRRGADSAHVYFAKYHQQHKLRGNSKEFGVAMALNAANMGNHALQSILANLNVDEHLRLNAISITNRTAGITYHGQAKEMFGQVSDTVTKAEILKTMELKTANYTFVNPIHVGMVLAGAGCEHTDAITPYATKLGIAFQIVNDFDGILGQEVLDNPKSNDLTEGKHTLFVVNALQLAPKQDKEFLSEMLGNKGISQLELERCQQIIRDFGLAPAKATFDSLVDVALESLDQVKLNWNKQTHKLLIEIAEALRAKIIV